MRIRIDLTLLAPATIAPSGLLRFVRCQQANAAR